MSLGQIAGLRLVQKVRHYEALVKSSTTFASRHAFLQTNRSSCQLAAVKSNISTINNNGTEHQLLTKRLINPAMNAQQVRCSSAMSHWLKDKIFTSSLPLLIPLAFMMEHPVTDGLVAVLSVLHAHWGFEAILTDYARPIIMGPILPEVLQLLLLLFSTFTLCGLILIIYNGPGLAKGIKQLWAVGSKKEKAA